MRTYGTSKSIDLPAIGVNGVNRRVQCNRMRVIDYPPSDTADPLEVGVGEGGATAERVEANGDVDEELDEGRAAKKGGVADAFERGGQRELGERSASLERAPADGDEAAGKHASGERATVADGIVADRSDVGEAPAE